MKIREKINLDAEGLWKYGPINIALFGDSITHGAVGNDIDYDAVYWNVTQKMLHQFRDYVPINIINAGIGGGNSYRSLARLHRDVISHHPDLIVVCFGLNDVGLELPLYIQSMETIFRQCLESGAEVIFMTPNTLNFYVAEDTPPIHLEYAHITAGYQTEGRMDTYMEAAKATARELGVTICDCYEAWKQLERDGVDTTMLLGNRINHPNAEMHKKMGQMLFETIMGQDSVAMGGDTSTMCDVAKK